MVIKDGTDINTMTMVDMTWSVNLFFFKAAHMPSPIPSGTDIITGQILVLTVVHNLESFQEEPTITVIASTLGEIEVEVPQFPLNNPLTQAQY